MMQKQLRAIEQDPVMKRDAAAYAASVERRCSAQRSPVRIEKIIAQAYLMGAKKAFCIGYAEAERENAKVYGEVIRTMERNAVTLRTQLDAARAAQERYRLASKGGGAADQCVDELGLVGNRGKNGGSLG